MSDSKAVLAMREGMALCPEEFATMPLKAVWLAGFMRGYRFRQEECTEPDGPVQAVPVSLEPGGIESSSVDHENGRSER